MKIDKVVSELCQEIDDLKENVEFWKNQHHIYKQKYNELLQSCEEHNSKMMQNVLDLTLKNQDKL